MAGLFFPLAAPSERFWGGPGEEHCPGRPGCCQSLDSLTAPELWSDAASIPGSRPPSCLSGCGKPRSLPCPHHLGPLQTLIRAKLEGREAL